MANERQHHYLLATTGELWAIEQRRMRAYLNTLIVSDMTAEDMEKRTGPRTPKTKRSIAVLPLLGPITQRACLFCAFFGGTSTEKWGAAFDELVASDNVGAIVLDVDSPGGTVDGVPELAAKIYQARGTKPIIAVANTWIASAAYWIASAADQIVVTPSGEVGSIGVWIMHVDYSKWLEMEGEDVTLISAGKHKVDLNPYEPLNDDGRTELQAIVDRTYGMFVGDVARHRGTTAKAVREGFGEGRMVGPKAAVAAGMADRVGTLDETIQRLGGRLEDVAAAQAARAERERELAAFEAEVGHG